MRVSEHIQTSQKTAFSFELLPPPKGNGIRHVFNTIDRLREFDPKYINITAHHSEVSLVEQDGLSRKVNVRRRPGTVAIAAAIQNRYGITAVPHVVCKGFTKEETEYALIDLNFLGVTDLLLLRGDVGKLSESQKQMDSHHFASDLQNQVNLFNQGISFDGSLHPALEEPFSYGMACYPEMHAETPSMESEIFYTKQKVENGAEYLVTQMFFDNRKYFDFVKRCRAEGIQVPIIPGIKPIHLKNQLTVLPQVFGTELPKPLAEAIANCSSDDEAREIGVEWCIRQCRELIQHQVPSIHFYSFMATESVYRVAKEIY